MTIQRILFPVDFSDRAETLAPFVHSIAQRHQAAAVLLHVIHPPPALYGGLDADGGTGAVFPQTFDYETSRKTLLKKLDEFAAREMPKLEISSVVEIGDPAKTITEYANENNIDLICMATHGHGAFHRMLLGSVAARILHDTKIPVWMSAHAPEATHRAHPQPRHILAAIDPGEMAQQTLEAAVALASETKATLQVVTAVEEGVLARSMSDAQLDELLVNGTRDLLAKLQFETGTQLETIVEVGKPADVIRAAALTNRADLVICGRGETTYPIIREAPCPVLSSVG